MKKPSERINDIVMGRLHTQEGQTEPCSCWAIIRYLDELSGQEKRVHVFPYAGHVKSARVAKRIKQSDLALMLGISRQMMNYIENSRRIPGQALQDRIRQLLGLDENWTAQAS